MAETIAPLVAQKTKEAIDFLSTRTTTSHRGHLDIPIGSKLWEPSDVYPRFRTQYSIDGNRADRRGYLTIPRVEIPDAPRLRLNVEHRFKSNIDGVSVNEFYERWTVNCFEPQYWNNLHKPMVRKVGPKFAFQEETAEREIEYIPSESSPVVHVFRNDGNMQHDRYFARKGSTAPSFVRSTGRRHDLKTARSDEPIAESENNFKDLITLLDQIKEIAGPSIAIV